MRTNCAAADLVNVLLPLINSRGLTFRECDTVANALDWVRQDAPEVYRRLVAVDPFRARLAEQAELLRFAAAGQCRGQVDIFGDEFQPT